MRSIIKKNNDKCSISDTFKIDDITITDPIKIPTSKKSLFLTPTDQNEVSDVIKVMKAKRSTGFDNISSWLIKKLNTSICNSLAVVISKSLEQGCFPEKLKIAKVVPIYKAKNREQLTNYRPISLLNSLSKIYEKLMYKRLYGFVEPIL